MPIRARLTLWYGVLLSLTLLVFCLALYLALEAALARNLDQTLRVRAAQVERELASSQDDDLELTPDEIQPGDLEPDALEDFAEPGVYVQVLSRHGAILATSGTSLPVSKANVGRAAEGAEAFDTLTVGGGQLLRTLYWPVRARDSVLAVVQVAETLEMVDETMRDARNLMLGGGLALLVAALGSGWLLTRRALAPVTAVTDAARHIAQTGRFDRRLAVAQPRDELSALASTFDVMIARIEQIISQQREFLADTSHELRNPLSVIRGNLDFVRRVTSDQSCLESLHEAEVEAARMSRLVNDLLLLAQADTGEFLDPRPVRIDLLVQELAEQARAFADGQVVTVSAPAELRIEADPDRLRQLVWNLVENALRHTPAGGRVDLAVRPTANAVSIDVRDTGSGVPPGHEGRVFERFYRADPSRTRSTGGAGLGLAIARHIAEAHGGTVSLDNRPGQGATFTVTLPLGTPAGRQSGAATDVQGARGVDEPSPSFARS